MSDPILNPLGQRYKRNVLLILVLGNLMTWVNGIESNRFAIFNLEVNNNIWWIGALIFAYQLIFYIKTERIDYSTWINGLGSFDHSIEVLFGRKPTSMIKTNVPQHPQKTTILTDPTEKFPQLYSWQATYYDNEGASLDPPDRPDKIKTENKTSIDNLRSAYTIHKYYENYLIVVMGFLLMIGFICKTPWA